jgi:hypothetical protein
MRRLTPVFVFLPLLGERKQAAKSQLQAVEQEAQSLTGRNRTLEQQVAAAAEQAKLDKEIFEREKKALQNSYDAVIVTKDQQIAVWQQRALEGQQMTAGEIAAAKVRYAALLICAVEISKCSPHVRFVIGQAKLEEAEQALMDHKSKRLTARTEMIQLAESLEKCQEVNRSMDQAVQNTLLPMASEQVSALESALAAIEAASSSLASKRTVQFQNRANELLTRRFRRQRDSMPAPPTNRRQASNEMVPFGSPRSSHRNGTLHGRKKEIGADSLHHVEMLRDELNRLAAGLSLLSQSVERLSELVHMDTRCCGSFWDLLTMAFSDSSTRSRGYSNLSPYENLPRTSESEQQDTLLTSTAERSETRAGRGAMLEPINALEEMTTFDDIQLVDEHEVDL